MAHTILEFQNTKLSDYKKNVDLPIGFSWTALFFTSLTMIYRKQILLSIVWMFFAYFSTYVFGPLLFHQIGMNILIGSFLFTLIVRILLASFYNIFCIYRLKEKGYKLVGARPVKGKIIEELPIEIIAEKYGVDFVRKR